MACHPTGKQDKLFRKSITKRHVDQWDQTRNVLTLLPPSGSEDQVPRLFKALSAVCVFQVCTY